MLFCYVVLVCCVVGVLVVCLMWVCCVFGDVHVLWFCVWSCLFVCVCCVFWFWLGCVILRCSLVVSLLMCVVVLLALFRLCCAVVIRYLLSLSRCAII